MSDHAEPDWLPEGVRQAPPDQLSSSLPLKGREEESNPPSVGHLKWGPEFWNEPEDAGEDLIRCGVLIHGQINVLEGHYEMGKTVVLVDLARQWIELHGPVLHLDFEMGMRRVRKRMKANQWSQQHLDRWHYAYTPTIQDGKLTIMSQLLGPDLLITLDSYSQAMMSMGLEENSATEAGGWWIELQKACSAGATVAVIDQVKQSASAASSYGGRGTGAKSFGADVKWFVERFEKFSPTQVGLIRMTLKKDREGVLEQRVGYRVGDGKGNLTLERVDAPSGDPADPTLLDHVLDVLAGPEAEANDGWLSTNKIKEFSEGYGYAKIKTALEYHLDKGTVETGINGGKGGGVAWRLADQTKETT